MDFEKLNGLKRTHKCGELTKADAGSEVVVMGFTNSVRNLGALNFINIRDISSEYPYSLFDFQCYINGTIHYAIVFSTYTISIYFNLSSWQNQFINTFDNVEIFLVTDVGDKNNIIKINKNDLMEFSVMMNSVRFVK